MPTPAELLLPTSFIAKVCWEGGWIDEYKYHYDYHYHRKSEITTVSEFIYKIINVRSDNSNGSYAVKHAILVGDRRVNNTCKTISQFYRLYIYIFPKTDYEIVGQASKVHINVFAGDTTV